MLKRLIPSLSFIAALLVVSGCQVEANADEKAAKQDANAEVPEKLSTSISEKFSAARKDLKVKDVEATGVDGIYKVNFDGRGGSVYAVAEGDFFFVGDLYQIDGKRIVNVTEQASNGPRAELMASIKKDDFITFSPKGETKASVVVFTDVDCGYCRKLHKEIPRLNEMGVEVKYLAYPRAGIGSNSYNKIASAWCAEDRQDAMNKLKAGEEIPMNVCESNPVAEQFNIGIQAGLNGTPAIVLDSGELIPGYMPADKLAQTIGI